MKSIILSQEKKIINFSLEITIYSQKLKLTSLLLFPILYYFSVNIHLIRQ